MKLSFSSSTRFAAFCISTFHLLLTCDVAVGAPIPIKNGISFTIIKREPSPFGGGGGGGFPGFGGGGGGGFPGFGAGGFQPPHGIPMGPPPGMPPFGGGGHMPFGPPPGGMPGGMPGGGMPGGGGGGGGGGGEGGGGEGGGGGGEGGGGGGGGEGGGGGGEGGGGGGGGEAAAAPAAEGGGDGGGGGDGDNPEQALYYISEHTVATSRIPNMKFSIASVYVPFVAFAFAIISISSNEVSAAPIPASLLWTVAKSAIIKRSPADPPVPTNPFPTVLTPDPSSKPKPNPKPIPGYPEPKPKPEPFPKPNPSPYPQPKPEPKPKHGGTWPPPTGNTPKPKNPPTGFKIPKYQ
ncbi:uncharacterized protein FA14DRAFT_178585 [Meira miltonrushii]|uniref:Uncharacterized protein n=1 Tax=Meira miltonrushii TaxID=1280837 RepID=A0A316VCK2_9BASI|nr:uncharacterized protein FA14DRAFT_178585 [Meira miltonrushii]PWN35210.1 hypothetical protein FA14DRAFT_178585 [Meira miltonrushii]